MIADRLAAACREHPLREKILVVPSLAIGHQIADAVAFGGTPWVNLRMETVRTISDAVAGFDLAGRGFTVLSRAQALAVIERACDRVLDESSYFAALLGRPGLYRAIQRSVDDLRHAGVNPEAIPKGAFEDERKARDLGLIIGAYERELRDRKFVDRCGVISRAIELAGQGTWSRDALWFVLDEIELTNLEKRLLDAIGAGTILSISAGNHDAARPPLEVEFARAVGEENELRGALRAAVTLDEAEVVYTSRDPYLSLAYELTSEYAIPATFAEGIAAPFTRPGQAAIGFLDWLGDDYNTTHLQRIARSGALRTPEAVPPAVFARLLRASMIGWGRDRYVPRLEASITEVERALEESESESRSEWLTKEIERRREALNVAQSLLEIGAIESLPGAALAFVDRFAATRNEIDGMALAALRRLLQELAALEEPAAHGERARDPKDIDRLIEAIAATHVAASNPRPGHLHVTSMRAGGWSGRKRMFLVGLDDTRHPGAGLQDPVVLDEERRNINSSIGPGQLDLLGDQPARNAARLARLIERAGAARWTVSYADVDLRDRRARFPSKDLLELFRAARHESDARYDALVAGSTVEGFLEDRAPLSESEWWLGQRFVRGRQDLRPELWSAYPWLAQGERARQARATDEITAWDGRIDVSPVDIDPRCTGRVYSASQMERMARCPFGWFVERVLHIQPVEELLRVDDRWLDNRQFGVLVHEVLQETMEEICANGETPSHAAHVGRMRAIGETALLQWRSEVPPATESAFARQRDELFAASDVFLRTEEQRCAEVEPKFFEAPFGMPKAQASSIGMIEPLVIPLGAGTSVKLRGQIDRVDRDRHTGNWQVWDYKTGSLYEYREEWRLRRGTKLQHVIYTRALTEMLRGRGLPGSVDCAGYYFPTSKGDGARIARECAPGELEHALNLLFDVIGSGWFPLPDDGKCDFCDFRGLCGNPEEAKEGMARKQTANANDPAVMAWRRLQEVG